MIIYVQQNAGGSIQLRGYHATITVLLRARHLIHQLSFSDKENLWLYSYSLHFSPQGKLFCHYLTKCLILRKSLFKSRIKFACANNPSNTYDTRISTIYKKGKSLLPNVWMGKFSRLNSTSYVDTSNPVKSNLFGESQKSEPKCGVSL